jgi:hypothetical protein
MRPEADGRRAVHEVADAATSTSASEACYSTSLAAAAGLSAASRLPKVSAASTPSQATVALRNLVARRAVMDRLYREIDGGGAWSDSWHNHDDEDDDEDDDDEDDDDDDDEDDDDEHQFAMPVAHRFLLGHYQNEDDEIDSAEDDEDDDHEHDEDNDDDEDDTDVVFYSPVYSREPTLLGTKRTRHQETSSTTGDEEGQQRARPRIDSNASE